MKKLLLILLAIPLIASAAEQPLKLTLRSRVDVLGLPSVTDTLEKSADFKPSETALIIVDAWDQHWCAGANRRLAPIAARIDKLADTLRKQGALIIHAPSDTTNKTYADHPARKLAKSAPFAKAPASVEGWCSLIAAREGKLPIDDSDGGCDCTPRCKDHIAWTGEHPAIHIVAGDIISESGQEIYNNLHARGIRNILYAGVHANMCVLGRSFGIRRMTDCGFNVALIRDLTDTMYNPAKAPFVPHDRGTDLLISHIEKNWCPTILSSQILDDAKPQQVVVAINEQEYNARETLTSFATTGIQQRMGLRVTVLQGEKPEALPNTDAIASADLLVIFMRRTTLPEDQLSRFKAHFAAGKPVIGLRTASHAFQNYLDFDKDVLGGNYHNHYGKTVPLTVSPVTETSKHPLLRGITPLEFKSNASLYKTSPLAESAMMLLTGSLPDQAAEPLAWTNAHAGGRVFYTSLGHPDDFKSPQFKTLLGNAVLWCLDRPNPPR